MQNKKIQYKNGKQWNLKSLYEKSYVLLFRWYNEIKLEYFDLDNILIDKKLHKNILIYEISYKTLINLWELDLMK